MFQTIRTALLGFGLVAFFLAQPVNAQDWPQWRGPNRDGKAAGFKAPESWPEKLTQQWKVEVGDGDSTPALVGGKLYVFTRVGGDEVIRCLDAATGKEVWQQKSAAAPVRGAASRHPGPRSSPTVAEGKVVTLGVEGVLICYDAKSGKQLWRHDDYKGAIPRFSTSSSPIVVDGLCIAQLGGSSGVIVAYDLATGKEKWKWTGSGPAYASPVLATLGGKKMIITPTDGNLVALDVATGSALWQMSYSQGRYNAATPMIDGDTMVIAGPRSGMTAEKLALQDGKMTVQELWKNTDNSVQFNTPVLKDGLLYGLSSSDSVFCINVKSGATNWSAPLIESAGSSSAGSSRGGGRGRGGRGGRGGGMGRGGFGSVVDTGSVLLGLTPAGQLTVFGPSKEKLERLASYKVAEGGTYAYPVVSGNRIFIKDADSITLWTTG